MSCGHAYESLSLSPMELPFNFTKCLVLCLCLVILQIQIKGQRGCHEPERMALLEFKALLKSDGYDADHLLPTWIDDPRSQCCSWERVACNHSTGHVTRLSLSNTRQFDGLSMLDEENVWLLNMSLFNPFKQLRVLNLSFNGIGDWTDDNEEVSTLEELETLDLRGNMLSNRMISSLSGLASLTNLILARNQLKGSFPAREIIRMTKLERLDMSSNSLDGSISKQGFLYLSKLPKLKYLNLRSNLIGNKITKILGKLSSLSYLDLSYNKLEGSFLSHELLNLSKLEVIILQGNLLNGTLPVRELMAFPNLQILDLGVNNFNGAIPPYMGASLSSLKALSVVRNKLTGPSSIQGLCGLERLEELDLSENRLEGKLPQCLQNLSSLRLLDLSDNMLVGRVSSSLMAALSSLEYINLGYNQLEGLFSFSSIGNHSKLEVVQFVNNNDKFEIVTEDSGWTPRFQLKVLVLSNCNLNKITNAIPSFLLTQKQLRVLSLSHNKLKGRFPGWLVANNTKLEFLSLRNNSFSGQFYLPINSSMNSTWIDVSDNQLEGQIQENVGKLFPNLLCLNVSRNALEGKIPTSIGDIRKLEALDLSSNNFFGEVPKGLFAGCTDLQFLKLSQNGFEGEFFSSQYNLSGLRVLRLNDNRFTGSLSNVKFNSNSLTLFDISNNLLSGKIPSWISNMTNLSILNMRNNSFEGDTQCAPFSFRYVDLSHNSLSGTLPSCSNIQDIEQIHLQDNNFTGGVPTGFLNSSTLLVLNLRENKLAGSIPNLIGMLSSLRVLLLRGNAFSGVIPKQLCQLKSVSMMDLSVNQFSGPIPLCFDNITFGKMEPHLMSISEKSTHLDYSIGNYKGRNLLKRDFFIEETTDGSILQVEIEFVTKNRPSSYKGDILNYMSGLDLSCNNLDGEIPRALGNLSWIRALNLSHNQLTGSIPTTFGKLTEIESLDLSYNRLSGEIPSELTLLYSLAVFSVSYNNLSGKLPERKAQFGTFDNSSYEGNIFLCGLPLERVCNPGDESPPTPTSSMPREKWYENEVTVFLGSFIASFIIFFLGVITVLYVNPYWRRRVFWHGEELIFSCYFCVKDFIFFRLRDLVSRLCHWQ
ncbi:hypothetical protein K2173_019019 [Erythroxylum novogranatense]|uniref:Leucine-rich repeat-containing N-terminal plant-type domain-containing protein n=1 Tax=Erythroxylum novogranatense TaxID=1862640 RepID=A0AAV8ST95_9ROSI|nr:hypothetical protein K2173_019019 [Erythroxylum novogranatense]